MCGWGRERESIVEQIQFVSISAAAHQTHEHEPLCLWFLEAFGFIVGRVHKCVRASTQSVNTVQWTVFAEHWMKVCVVALALRMCGCRGCRVYATMSFESNGYLKFKWLNKNILCTDKTDTYYNHYCVTYSQIIIMLLLTAIFTHTKTHFAIKQTINHFFFSVFVYNSTDKSTSSRTYYFYF